MDGANLPPALPPPMKETAMSYSLMSILPDRGLIEVKGPDAAGFLQGLITNDIERARLGEAIFAGLLTPQGKILFDFLIHVRDAETYWIDCSASQAGDLVKRLGMYKLRAKIAIADRSGEFAVGAAWGAEPREGNDAFIAAYADPRYPPLGERIVLKRRQGEEAASLASPVAGAGAYHSHRIALAVPQGGLDYAYGEAFPHEACYDSLNGVDFKKGCYVGQEVVSRMHHKGVAKTRIAGLLAEAPLSGGGIEIRAGDTPVGTVGSVDGTRGIAMVRLDRAEEALRNGVPLRAGEVTVALRRPPWARYEVPGGDTGA
jgi:folate-binding protein YgfZ